MQAQVEIIEYKPWWRSYKPKVEILQPYVEIMQAQEEGLAPPQQRPHCPKNKQIYLAYKPEKHRCICSNRNSIDLYAKIQVIFETV